MEKLLALLLVLCMVFGITACSKDEPAANTTSGGETMESTQETTQVPEDSSVATDPTSVTEAVELEGKELRVGYARENITPAYSVPLAGYGNTTQRMSRGIILRDIFTTCIAITDSDDSTVLLFTSDIILTKEDFVAEMRAAISAATGVPAERIMLTYTHTHSAPDCSSTHESIVQFKAEFTQMAVKAAQDALADRSEATIETGTAYTKSMNFVRHYTTTSGELFGDNLTLKGSITGHTSKPDNEIQLICFRREAADKKDILAVNWQVHAKMDSTLLTGDGTSNRPKLSSDFVGVTRDYVEKKADCLFAFYQGAAGNLNPDSRLSDEMEYTDCESYGEAFGDYVLGGMQNLKAAQAAVHKVTVTQQKYSATIDHTEDSKVEDARKIWQAFVDTNNRTTALKAAPGAAIYSVYHAGSILNRSAATKDSDEMELCAIRVGPLGFVTAPYEMFDTNGMQIKDGSPFETTFILTCANGYNNYIASEYAFQGKGTYEVHNRMYVRGTAEALVDTFVGMLKALV